MAVISTLRSLCMLRVHQLHIPAYLLTTKYLPAQLARDLAKARLFQGNFMFSDRVNGRTIEVALTISYDGENWIFSHRSQDVLMLPQFCCEVCDVNRPKLVTVVMQEGVSHPTFLSEVPYNLNLEWLKPQGMGPDIKLSVEMEKDGCRGILAFMGPTFKKYFEVTLKKLGRTLVIRNSSSNFLATQKFYLAPGSSLRRLKSVDLTADMAFPETQNGICSNPNFWL